MFLMEMLHLDIITSNKRNAPAPGRAAKICDLGAKTKFLCRWRSFGSQGGARIGQDWRQDWGKDGAQDRGPGGANVRPRVEPSCAKLVVFVCSWLLLAAVGSCWLLLVALGCCWLLLAGLGCCWLLLTALGCCSWLLLAAPGCCWLLLAATGCC